MRILHTSDWHTGRTVKGRGRDDEHREVLDEIVGIVRQEGVDLVVVAGDIFDHAAPSAAAEEIVYNALLALRDSGTRVVLVSGNHDSAIRLRAVKPLLDRLGVVTGAMLERPNDGGCVTIPVERTGETARVALLPWLSQRGIVTADVLMDEEMAGRQVRYAARCEAVLAALCKEMQPAGTVNVLAAHVCLADAALPEGGGDDRTFAALLGGGERTAETIFDYWVHPQALPKHLHYAALGHIHRQQQMRAAGCPAWYSGSPLQLDFGEKPAGQGVLLIDAYPGQPAVVKPVPLSSGRKLGIVSGTLAEVRAKVDGGTLGDAWLRVDLDERPHPGLADELRELSPNIVDIRITHRAEAEGPSTAPRPNGPGELFHAYLESRSENDDAVEALFSELLAEVR